MGDAELVQIVDKALAEAVTKSGAWLVCRPGCWECCRGPFAITQLDAARLRQGLSELEGSDPARAARVRERARAAVARMPEGADLEELLAAVPDEEPCAALDPETGTCDLYAARPVTCRLFGPPIRWGGDAVGVCELCFEGASNEEIAACEVVVELELGRDETLVALAIG